MTVYKLMVKDEKGTRCLCKAESWYHVNNMWYLYCYLGRMDGKIEMEEE